MDKRVQAKHVPEAPILRFLATLQRAHGVTHKTLPRPATHWVDERPPENIDGDPWSIPSEVPEAAGFPWKVLLAKMAAMQRRGLVDGCACGCRGDWVITDKGRAALEGGT